jgi:hypothetical protein
MNCDPEQVPVLALTEFSVVVDEATELRAVVTVDRFTPACGMVTPAAKAPALMFPGVRLVMDAPEAAG